MVIHDTDFNLKTNNFTINVIYALLLFWLLNDKQIDEHFNDSKQQLKSWKNQHMQNCKHSMK